MNRKNIGALLVGLLLLGAAAIWYINRGDGVPDSITPNELYAFDSEVCPGESRRMKMDDVYMRGLLEIGENFTAQMNWYKCHKFAANDMVLYRFTGKKIPVVRRVVAIPGDKIEVVYDRGLKAWTLSVNAALITDGQNPYFFGGEPPPPLKLYEQAHQGVVGEAEVILLSSFPPGSDDSGTFGAIAVQDVVAKVEKVAR